MLLNTGLGKEIKMQITAINTTVMFIDDECQCQCECKCEPQSLQTVTKPEIKPATVAKTEEKPKLQEPLKTDTVEISKKSEKP